MAARDNASSACDGSRAPYRGIRRQNQCRPGSSAHAAAPANVPEAGLARRSAMRGGLLAVGFQHLVAGRRDLGAVLLQAGQDGEIALIDHRAAEALHVTGTGLLLLGRSAALLLGEGIRCNR